MPLLESNVGNDVNKDIDIETNAVRVLYKYDDATNTVVVCGTEWVNPQLRKQYVN